MKLKFWGDKPDAPQEDPNEADAMRGKYSYEDLKDRKRQLLATEITGRGADEKEDWVDTMRRARSAITNGQGALGRDFAIGQTSAIADNQLQMITRLCGNLSENNALRRFMEADEKNYFHLAVDKSIERDQPEVVMAYKPMISPNALMPVTTGDQSEAVDKRKKAP